MLHRDLTFVILTICEISFFPFRVFFAFQNSAGVFDSFRAGHRRFFKRIRNSHFPIFHDSQSVVRQDFHALDVGKRPNEVARFSQIFVVVGNAGNQNVANPNRLFDFVEESEHFDYVFVAAPRKRDMLGGVDVLYVHQKDVRDFHQFFEFLEPFALARERRARSVDAGVDAAFFCERKKFKKKIDLRQWLAAARSDAALFSPIRAAGFGLVQKAFRGTPLAAFHFPSVGVVAEFAAHRAACEKNYVAHSRPVHRAERFDFVDVSVHNFIVAQILKMGKCKMKIWVGYGVNKGGKYRKSIFVG